MNKKIYITSLIAAMVLWTGGSSGPQAAIYDSLNYQSPGMPFWPTGNSIGSGKLRFFPELAVGVVHNDNIFLDSSDEESDVITHVIPRLMIDYSLEERGSIKLGYAGDFAFYADFTDNDWQKHDVGFCDRYALNGKKFHECLDELGLNMFAVNLIFKDMQKELRKMKQLGMY